MNVRKNGEIYEMYNWVIASGQLILNISNHISLGDKDLEIHSLTTVIEQIRSFLVTSTVGKNGKLVWNSEEHYYLGENHWKTAYNFSLREDNSMI